MEENAVRVYAVKSVPNTHCFYLSSTGSCFANLQNIYILFVNKDIKSNNNKSVIRCHSMLNATVNQGLQILLMSGVNVTSALQILE